MINNAWTTQRAELVGRLGDGALVVERRPGATWITLNAPASRNALTLAVLRDLPGVLVCAAEDPSCAAIVITGAPGGGFCSGFDLRELDPKRTLEITDAVRSAFGAVERCPLPSIASIDGPCVGAGLELALSCDLRVCTAASTFQLPAARLGVNYPVRGLERLAAAVGVAEARRIALLGERIAAADAWRSGVVHVVAESLAETVDDWVRRLTEGDPAAIAGMRRTFLALGTDAEATT